MRTNRRAGTTRQVVLFVSTLLMVLPFIWILLSSFKSNDEIFQIPFRWLPSTWHFENYILPFQGHPFAGYFANSFLVAVVVTVSNLLFDSVVGYALAQFRFPGRAVLFYFILATMMLPLQVTIVPMFLIVKSFGWLNSYLALTVPGFMSAFGVFLMRQWFLSFPKELVDAARIDGSSELGIFARIALPTAGPSLSALAIFIFMGNWDSFLWPLVVVNKDKFMTLPLGIASFVGQYQTAYNQLMAVSILAMIPILVVFLVFQRSFVQGIATSGIKG